ncbi:MAG: (2Fe-2S)-binding protein [Nocardioidaceae bacterium]|nr:MAG: (2Fe-2S)-binding protein [Nocardioidaceae bacterium]
MSSHLVRPIVNGTATQVEVEARAPLSDLLRLKLGLTGTKVSCEAQICGACTVLVDGMPVSSCTYLGVDVDRREVTTIEGASDGEALGIVQQAFVDAGAIQCGYCTPGFVLAVTALLESIPAPTIEEAKHYLDGNICRCTGYEQILEAVLAAARSRKDSRE